MAQSCLCCVPSACPGYERNQEGALQLSGRLGSRGGPASSLQWPRLLTADASYPVLHYSLELGMGEGRSWGHRSFSPGDPFKSVPNVSCARSFVPTTS